MKTNWARDWCILGTLSGLLAPVGMGAPLVAPVFCLVSMFVGGLSGLLLGPLLNEGLHRLRGHFAPPLAVVGLVVGALWGALVGGAAGLFADASTASFDAVGLGTVFGAMSGSVQLAWFLPAYVWGRLRDQCAGVLTLAGLFSPGLAWAACLLIATVVVPAAVLANLMMRL